MLNSSLGLAKWVTVALAALSLSACDSRQKTHNSAPVTSTSVQGAKSPGLTRELEHLIQLSKAKLSPTEKRQRLQQALEHFPQQHSKEREQLIVSAIAEGALDPPEWTTITSSYQGRRASIQVTTDALTILGVRFDVTAEGAQRVADTLGAILPTPRILQLIWEQANVRLDPCTLPADHKMASTERMIEHSACVDAKLKGRTGLVANVGKHWVLTNRIAGKKNLAANYGWFRKGRRPIQTVGTRHDTAHTDYSQVVRLVKPTIVVDGRDIDIRHVGRSPDLWGLVSDEGPLLVWRAARPGVAPSPSDDETQAAPAPEPGDPQQVKLHLELNGMPVEPSRLPETTTGLRRKTLARRLAQALRMRPADIPKEALWSAGASICGGSDLFFEMMNNVPLDVAELRKKTALVQRALACGKQLSPVFRKKTSLYEVEYDYDKVPSGFALLALEDDSLRDKVLYPPLSPTPHGVHRAYCNDDEGGPRKVCRDGARSRLILGVNQGYLAAYAREVPSLLTRLAQPQKADSRVQELAELFLADKQAEEVAFAVGGLCGFTLELSLVSLSPDETARQRILDAINDNTRFCGTLSSGSTLWPTRQFVFVAKSASAAKVLASALRRRAHEIRFEAGVAGTRTGVELEFDEALRSAVARATKNARFVLKGDRLDVSVSGVPTAQELRKMAGLLDARKAKAGLAAALIRRLAAGQLPSSELLDPFTSSQENAQNPAPSSEPAKANSK